MAISNIAGVVSAAKQERAFYKANVTTGASQPTSFWEAAGNPVAGANPSSTSGIVTTSSTTGALLLVNPKSGNTLYLGSLMATGNNAGTLILYDRLVTSDGLSGTVTSAQTVGTPALTRYTSGVDVELWLEWYATAGATSVTVTASYTNQAGTSGQTTPSLTLAASRKIHYMQQLPLAAGDTGVQAVASVTLSASTGTAGNFGVTLLRRIAEIPVGLQLVEEQQDPLTLGLPQIQSNACLAFMLINSAGAASGPIMGRITTVEG